MNPPPPRVVLKSTTKRDALLAIVAGLLVLAFVGFGVLHLSRPVKGNKLTGVILEKSFSPLKEQQVEFNGRQLRQTREIDGEYLFKVRVKGEERIYEVPVEKPMYETKKIGDSVTFLRPESEQR